MDRKLTITYYLHSGFSVAMEDVLLVFDYWTGEQGELPQDKRITPEFLRTFREVYVFISHEHPDHLDPVVNTRSSVSAHHLYRLRRHAHRHPGQAHGPRGCPDPVPPGAGEGL